MAIVTADYPFRQERYTLWRYVIRDFLLRTLGFHVLVKVDVQGLDHIPADGPTLLIMNHIGAIDPVVVVGAVTPRFAVPMSKIENFSLPIFGRLLRFWGAYPVRRDQVDRPAVQNTLDLLREGHLVLIAPEGTRQPALIRAKVGAAYAATRTGATIIPIGIDGTREFTHNLKRLRQTQITLRIGRAFRFRRQGQVPRRQLPPMMDEAMYRIAALLPEHRRGYYADLPNATTDTIEFV